MPSVCVIWQNLNTGTYYFKFSKETYNKYYVGFKNQYNHIVILVIDLRPLIRVEYVPVTRRLKRLIIRFFKSIINFLEKY